MGALLVPWCVIRMNATGEVANETFVFPLAYPKIPPRMYFLFQQPITTEGLNSTQIF